MERKKITRVLFSIFLSICMVVTMMPLATGVYAGMTSSVECTTWAEVQAAFTAGINTVKLTDDITASSGDEALSVPSGKTVTLDLNGKTLSRGLTSGAAVSNGNVITVMGTLTITDTSSNTGKITGGNNSNNGGGIYCKGGTINITAGEICDNIANGKNYYGNGGGIYCENSIINITGGKIYGNTSNINGGGIYCKWGTINITAGEICGNTVEGNSGFGNGGGILCKISTINMSGGKIYGNSVANNGGGISFESCSRQLNISGTAQIVSNVKGGTIDNTTKQCTGGSINNVFLNAGDTVIIGTSIAGINVDSLTSGASIGISTVVQPTSPAPVSITSEESADYSSFFSSDDANYFIENSGSGSSQVVKLKLRELSFSNEGLQFDIPEGFCGTNFSIDVSGGAFGGTKPYTFSKESGPDWLQVSSAGTISGTRPSTQAAATTATIKVIDSASASANITINIGAVKKQKGTLYFRNGTLRISDNDDGEVYDGNDTKWSVTSSGGAYTLNLNGFNYVSTSPTGLDIGDNNLTINVTGDNVISGADSDSTPCYGITGQNKLTLSGNGKLTATAGKATATISDGGSYGIKVKNLTINSGATLISAANESTNNNSYGAYVHTNAKIDGTFEGRSATAGGISCGLNVGANTSIGRTGRLSAVSGHGEDESYGFYGTSANNYGIIVSFAPSELSGSYGIALLGGLTINSGSITAKGGKKALSTSVTFVSGMVVKASTEYNGTNLVDYVEANKDTYKYITASSQPPVPTGGGSRTPSISVTDGVDNNTGGTATLDRTTGKLTITPAKDFKIKDVKVNGVSQGNVTELTGITGSKKVEVVFEKMTTEEKIAQAKGEMKDDKIITSSKRTKLRGKKAVKITWKVEGNYDFDGFVIYRSTKKNSGYGTKPFFKTKNMSYTNNKNIRVNKTYYYKIKGYIMIDGKMVLSQWSTKTWKKII